MDGKTVAGLVLLGVVLSLIIGYLASALDYTVSAMLNSTQGFEGAYNTTPPTITDKIGNYTVVVVKPQHTVLADIWDYLHSLVVLFARALSDEVTLASLLAISLIVAAVATRR